MIVSERRKPTAKTVGLAWDGKRLWAGDWQDCIIAALDATGAVESQYPAPGRVYGIAFREAVLHAVIGHPDSDDRTIHRFDVVAGAWEKHCLRCPESSGSHLAWDGGHLWLGQRYAKRLLQLHADGTVKHAVDLPWEVTGFAWRGATAWLNVRVEKGTSSLASLGPGAERPTEIERLSGPLASLADDGSGFWMSQLAGGDILKVAPAAPPMPSVTAHP